ncbi:Antiviral helicase SKI2 [Bienertia sinuspersici]
MIENLFENAILTFWHGGKFKVVDSRSLCMLGGKSRTFQADPDQFSVWHIMELASKTGGYSEVDSVYYLIKGQSLHDGLRHVKKDASVLEIGATSYENSDSDSELEDDLLGEDFKEYETQFEKLAANEGVMGESDNSHEEFVEARKRVTGYDSGYYDSADDLETPLGSGDEIEGGRRSRRGLLVGLDTDFKTFKWKVGQRFNTKDDFKSAVARYAIMQGRNVTVIVSNKARRQEVGVSCVTSCPFKLYGSWHSNKASFIVKKVAGEHNCHRDMKKNKQLKTSWVAREMLDVFKARPYWPAKDIIETTKRAYKVLVIRTFAYKVKYCAHKLLHGSMQDHYFELGRYMAALKASSEGTTMELVTGADYNDGMAELEELNVDVALAFKAVNPKCFCRASWIPQLKVMPSLITWWRLLMEVTKQEKGNGEEKKWTMNPVYIGEGEREGINTEVYLNSYAGYIPSIEGERRWPRVKMKVDPPPIKVGPCRPRKSRIKDPFKNPKKPVTLSRHGMEITCTLWKAKGHSKRGRPQKGFVQPSKPPPKKPRGRSKKEEPYTEPQPSQSHHQLSAQPTQLGRGGRMIFDGIGAKGGTTGRGGGKTNAGRGGGIGFSGGGYGGRGSSGRGSGGRGSGGRGVVMRGRGALRGRGRNQVLAGVGVFIAPDGTPIIPGLNHDIQRTQSSQGSAVINPTQ